MYVRLRTQASRRVINCVTPQILLPVACGTLASRLIFSTGPRLRSLSRTYSPSHHRLQYSTSTMAGLQEKLNPELLKEVHDFWFEGCKTADDFVLPQVETLMGWFASSEEFDARCVKLSAPALEAIRAAGITTGAQLIEAVKPQAPQDWLSLLILLDQMPRNCYRGDSAALAFTLFDPIAQGVALTAIKEHDLPYSAPEIRWQFSRRNWFFLPLMHSESPELHELLLEHYGRMKDDIDHLISIADDESKRDSWKARAHNVVKANHERAQNFTGQNLKIAHKHYDIIKEFGRYPHRNKALGRESTKEEIDYLENGGETFSSASLKKQKPEI